MEYQVMDRTIEEMKINSILRKRTVYVNEAICSESMFKLCYSLDRIVEIDNSKGIEKENLQPIHIVYSSFGGSIYDGLMGIGKLENLIENKGYKIISTVQGYAMSMGQSLAVVATERRATKHSRLMIHQPSSGCYGKLEELEASVEETMELWNEMKRILIKYTKMTDKDLEKIKKDKEDKFMWETEALEKGIIDKII